jgi:uncharacterized protein
MADHFTFVHSQENFMKSFLLIKSIFLFAFISCCNADEKSAVTLISAARSQIGVTTSYDPAYTQLKYPNGDVPIERGVCTDVVIRALRKCDIDLQKKVHEDMSANFSLYPKQWQLRSTDKNIDHRRVPNLMKFFTRKAKSLSTKNDFEPGDFVTCMVAGKLPHIMIVSDKKGSSGQWKIIHNIGSGTQEEDRLFEFPITGHYRWNW